MEKGPVPYHVATPKHEPKTYSREHAEILAEEMTRDTGVKHAIYPWKAVGAEIAYVIGRKVSGL